MGAPMALEALRFGGDPETLRPYIVVRLWIKLNRIKLMVIEDSCVARLIGFAEILLD